MATEDSQKKFMFFGFLHTHFLDLAAALTHLCMMYDYVPPTHVCTHMHTYKPLHRTGLCPQTHTHPPLHHVGLYVPLTHTHTYTHPPLHCVGLYVPLIPHTLTRLCTM